MNNIECYLSKLVKDILIKQTYKKAEEINVCDYISILYDEFLCNYDYKYIQIYVTVYYVHDKNLNDDGFIYDIQLHLSNNKVVIELDRGACASGGPVGKIYECNLNETNLIQLESIFLNYLETSYLLLNEFKYKYNILV